MPLHEAFVKAIDEGAAARCKSDTRTVIVDAPPAAAFAPVRRIGGATGWYFADALWRLRAWIDVGFGGAGMPRTRRDPEDCVVGDVIDGWRVEAHDPDRLLRLSAGLKLPGRGWLEFTVDPLDGGARSLIRQTATFDPRGIAGRLYWHGVLPLHALVFRGLLRRIAQRAVRDTATGDLSRFTYSSIIGAPAADVFRWHERPEALLDLLPSRRFVRIERRTGGLRDGGGVAFSIGIGPLRMPWEARHYGYVVGERFCDEQIRGPFRIWRHTHRFVAMGTEQTLYEDRVEYAVRGGRLVARLADPVVRYLLARMFARRHQIVRAACADARDAALRRRLVAPGITAVERLRMAR